MDLVRLKFAEDNIEEERLDQSTWITDLMFCHSTWIFETIEEAVSEGTNMSGFLNLASATLLGKGWNALHDNLEALFSSILKLAGITTTRQAVNFQHGPLETC